MSFESFTILSILYCPISKVRWPGSARHHSISENTTAFQKTQQHFRKHCSISENTAAFQKTLQHFRKRYSISENATAFQKTLQHLIKRRSIWQNAAAFQKTPQHFRKHYNISENTTGDCLHGKGLSGGTKVVLENCPTPQEGEAGNHPSCVQ